MPVGLRLKLQVILTKFYNSLFEGSCSRQIWTTNTVHVEERIKHSFPSRGFFSTFCAQCLLLFTSHEIVDIYQSKVNKHQYKVWNLLKVNNAGIRIKSMTLFWYLYCWLWTDSHLLGYLLLTLNREHLLLTLMHVGMTMIMIMMIIDMTKMLKKATFKNNDNCFSV